MRKNLDMFPVPKKPRNKPRKLMHMVNAGNHLSGGKGIEFECPRCLYNTGWIIDTKTVTENKRGMPCPECNKGDV